MRYFPIFLLLTLFSCQLDDPKSSFVESESNGLNVAILIMDGTYNTELTAPMDIFHHTKFRKGIEPMNVFTIAENTEAITTFENLKIIPDYSYLKTYPKIDVLVIPAAEHHLDSDLENKKLIAFIQRTSANAKFVTSHCDGAFLLAKTGLLDKRVSTTFPGDIIKYKTMYPELKVEENVLFVHDGKFITSAGGAKSFEASLYLCELLFGKENAGQLAQGLVIDWDLKTVPKLIIGQDDRSEQNSVH